MIEKNSLKYKKIILLSLFIVRGYGVNSQTFTDSNLHIVIIEIVNGAEIIDDSRIFGSMKIIQRPERARNFGSDA